MSVSSVDEVAVDGTGRTAPESGRSAPRLVSDLPGPRGLPLLGNGLRLLPLSRAHLTAEAWCERYGPIFQFHAGRRRAAVAGFVEQARAQMRQRPQLRECPENFLQAMLAAQEQDSTFTDAEIVGNVYTLLFAGEDTTAHSMAWTVWLLAQCPDIQARLAQESAAVLGEEPCPADLEAVSRFAYGEAVLRESMRLKPVSVWDSYEPLADTTICGARIPAGTRVVLLKRHVSRSAGGPAFDPERWLDHDEREAPDQKSFLNFGAGPRFCPGRNLAFLEAKSALAMIARDFEIKLDDSHGPVKESFSITMIPKGLRVRLRERAPGSFAVPAGVNPMISIMSLAHRTAANMLTAS